MIPAAAELSSDGKRELLASLLLRRHRQRFTALDGRVYLNYGAQGPLARPAIDVLRAFHDELDRRAPLGAEAAAAVLLASRRARATLAAELGVAARDLALVESTSVGCNIALWGIDWRPGDRLVISEREYPGVASAAAEVVRRFGVELSRWPLDGAREDLLAGLSRRLDRRTRAVVVSHIPWDSGAVVPLAEVAALCRELGGEGLCLIVDGAQAAGVLPLDLPALGVDVYAFTGHKWWCGPEGAGGLYVAPRALAALAPTFIGPRGLAFSAAGEVTGWRPDAARFEVSTAGAALHAGLEAALALHAEWGTAAARFERIRKLSRRLWEGLGALAPGRVDRLQEEPPEAGLVFFRLRGEEAQRAVRRLEARNVLVRAILHADALRASVHYLTLEEEVDELLAAVEALGRPAAAFSGTAASATARPAASEPTGSEPVASEQARAAEARFPLSFAQRRLWFLAELDPTSPAYNLLDGYRLRGRLDAAALARALAAIVRRQGALRTRFVFDRKEPEQVVAAAAEAAIHRIDLRRLDAGRRERAAYRIACEATCAPYDLARGPLHRFLLLDLDDAESALLLMMHHIVGDIWSFRVIHQELQALYAAFTSGKIPAMQPLAMQHGELALWERRPEHAATLAPQLDYWRGQLAGLQPLELLPDRPRPAVQTARGAARALPLPREVADRLAAAAAALGASVYMVALAAFLATLGRTARRSDPSCGSPIANRHRAELEALVGFFVNTLVIRADTGGDPTFAELAAQVRRTAIEAYAHPEAPFERLVEELGVDRDLSRTPLYQITFQYGHLAPPALPGLAAESFCLLGYGVARGDLELHLLTGEGGLLAVGVHNRDLFDASTAARLIDHFATLLRGALERPQTRLAELPWLGEAERAQATHEWNDTAADGEAPALPARFAAAAARHPERTAVESREVRWTYGELAARVRILAAHLRRQGVGPEAIVGLCARREPELALGALGVLAAGGAFLPLDPSYPRERLAFMLEDAGVVRVLTLADLAPALPAGDRAVDLLDAEWGRIERAAAGAPPLPAAPPDPDSPAYVIYTSGSTGRPKGVVVLHRGLANLAAWQARRFALGPESRVLQFASPSFDASVWEIAMALGSGATLCLPAAEEVVPGAELARRLGEGRITHATLPPSALAMLGEPALSDLGWLIVAGEACPQALAERWGADRHFFDAYGPTEGTVCATAAEHRAGERLTIGRPIANVEVLVLDPGLGAAAIGVPGELCLGGRLLARGYLGRPELTAERFVPHPGAAQPGARLYRTGDLARWLADGRIEFLGRLDGQVKVRGYRIEVEEVESVLLGHPAVGEAVVAVWEPRPGDRRLVAYVALRPGVEEDRAELRRHLHARLPGFMMPSALVVLAALPRTVSGKVDRRSLPAPAVVAVDSAAAFAVPAAGAEERIAQAWQELLLVERVGAADNFFDLGGNSLLMALLRRELERLFGRDISMVEMFRHPTVRAMAGFLTRGDERSPVAGGVERGEQRRGAAARRLQIRGGARGAPLEGGA